MTENEQTLTLILQDRRSLCLGAALRTQMCQLQLLELLLESRAARAPAAAGAGSRVPEGCPC